MLSKTKQPEADAILGITYDFRDGEDDDGKKILTCLTWDEVQSLKTEFFGKAIALYLDWCVFKILPNGKGTQDERPTVLEAIKILTSEDNQWQMAEMEAARNSK